MDRLITIVSLFFLIMGTTLRAGPYHQWPVLQEELPRWMKRFRVPGVQVVFLDKGQVIDPNSFGRNDPHQDIPMENHLLLPLGEWGKAFVARAIWKLIEDGTINPKLPINTYLSEWQIPSRLYNAGDVTVMTLLNQTDGLVWINHLGPSSGKSLPGILQSPNDYRSIRLAHRPGQEYRTGNAGYWVLYQVVRSLTGSPPLTYLKGEGLLPFNALPCSDMPGWEQVDTIVLHDPAPQPAESATWPPPRCGLSLADVARFLADWYAGKGMSDSLYQHLEQQPQSVPNWLWGNTFAFSNGFMGDRKTGLWVMEEDTGSGFVQYTVLDPRQGTGLVCASNSRRGKAVLCRLVRKWCTRNGYGPPPTVQSYLELEKATLLGAFFFLLIGLGIAVFLWQTRASRQLRSKLGWSRKLLLGSWLLLLGFFVLGGMPFVHYWMPHVYPVPAIPVFLYLAVLLLWVLFPASSSEWDGYR